MKRLGAHVLFWGLAVTMFATDARTEDARVLPKGRHRFSFTYGATQEVNSTYNGNGKREAMTESLELNAANLQKVARALKQLVGMLNNAGRGVGDELTAGNLDLEVKGYRQIYALTEQYGISERLSVGIQIPIIRGQVKVKKNLSGKNNASSLADQYAPGSAEDVKAGLRTVSNISVPMLEAEVSKLGYAPITSSDKSGIGDVAFGGRYAYIQDDRWVGSLQLGTTAPTGYVPAANELAAMPFGEGAWDIGAAHILNWSPTSWLMFGQGLHYTYKLMNAQTSRVPTSSDDVLPGPETERSIKRKMGDKIWGTLSLDWKPFAALTFGLGYEWYWRLQDRYYEMNGREIQLMRTGSHYLETASAQVTVSTIDMFLKHQFPVPANFLLTYYHPTVGKNNPIVRYTTAEVALFF